MATLVTWAARRGGWRAFYPVAQMATVGMAFAVTVGCTSIPSGRYAISKVGFEGTSQVESSDIEEKIATAESPRFLGLFRGLVLDYELYDRYILERDLTRIERYYRSRGYYEAHARAGRVQKIDDAHVRVNVVVDEGPSVNVGDVKLQGITNLPIDDAAALLRAIRRRLRIGRIFDEERYEDAQEQLVRALTDRGYAYAKVKGSVAVDLARHVADVMIDVTPGPIARIGAVSISGLGALPESPVRRALDLEPGELYSTSKLESAKRAVLGLGVFSEADVKPDLSHEGAVVVPVNVEVAPSDLRSVKLGGGIELDVIRTDVHAVTGWEDRNFLGGLRRFTIDLRPGVVIYPTRLPNFEKPRELLLEARARAELRQPGVIEARTGGLVRGEINVYPVLFGTKAPTSTDPTTGATVDSIPGYLDLSAGYGFDRPFGPFFVNLSYNFQNSFPFRYGGKVAELHKLVLSYLSLKTTLDLRDDAIRPHAGIFVSNDFQFAGLPVTPNFRGDNVLFATDLRVLPEIRGYVPLARGFTLVLRTAAGFLYPFASSYGNSFRPGTTATLDDIQLVFFRGFFSGGPNSNRGYAYRGVGPKGDVAAFLPGAIGDFPTGGLTLWEATAEVRFPISGDLGGVVFCDASDVSRYRFDLRFLYPHIACGTGLHYNTPVGAIGLDIGFPVPGLQVLDKKADASEKVAPNFFAVSIGIESR